MGSASFILAGVTVDITTADVILVLGVLALLVIGAIAYFWSMISILTNLGPAKRQSRVAIGVFIGGCLVLGAYGVALYWSALPADPELVVALEDVVAETAIDISAFNERGVRSYDFERADSCPFAQVGVDPIDWTTELLPVAGSPDGLAINEVLEMEAARLERSGWSVNRFVDGADFAWKGASDGPLLVATNDVYVFSISSQFRSILNSLEYRIERRSCAGDRAAELASGDHRREVDQFLILPDTIEQAQRHAEDIADYMWSEPSLVTSEYALGYGINQLCVTSRVESQVLSVDDRANVVDLAGFRMRADGWDVQMLSGGRRLQAVGQRDGRVAVVDFSTQISSENTVVLRSYPAGCADPDFVQIGFEAS